MSVLTQELLLKDRENLASQLESIDRLLKDRYGWTPTPAPKTKRASPAPIATAPKEQGEEGGNEPDSSEQAEGFAYTKLSQEWVVTAAGKVTVVDFRNWIATKYGDAGLNLASLNSPLRKLVDAGKLRAVKKGKGRRASIYEVTEPALAFDQNHPQY